jgi:hypothetical protein
MPKPSVAVFGLGADQISGLKVLKKKYCIIGFDDSKNCVGKKFVDKFFSIKITKKKKILNICKKLNIIACFSFSTEYPIPLIGWLNDKIKLPGFNYKTSILATNKFLFRKELHKHEIKFPYFKKISINALRKKKFNKNKIFKPISNSASRGVFVGKNNNEINKYLDMNRKYYNKNLIYENYLDGQLYAIDGWILDNNFIFASLSKKTKDLNHSFSDKTIIVNYQNSSLKKKAILLAIKSCLAIKAKNVPIHLEFIKNSKGLFPIDLAIRGAGSSIYSSCLSQIINKSTAQIQIALTFKKKIQNFKNNNKIIYLFFITAKKNFIFKGINNKEINKIKNKKSIVLLKKKNQMVFASNNSDSRIAIIKIYFRNKKHFYKKINRINKILKKIDFN